MHIGSFNLQSSTSLKLTTHPGKPKSPSITRIKNNNNVEWVKSSKWQDIILRDLVLVYHLVEKLFFCLTLICGFVAFKTLIIVTLFGLNPNLSMSWNDILITLRHFITLVRSVIITFQVTWFFSGILSTHFSYIII